MKLTVTTKKVAALKPCASRFDNFKAEYPNFKGSIEEFLDLDRINYHDKLWVTLRLVPRIVLEIFAVDCAAKTMEYCENAAKAAANAAAYAAKATADYATSYATKATADYATSYATNAVAYAASAANAAYAGANAANAAANAADAVEASEAAADAAYAAGEAAEAANATDAGERARQIEALIYLIQSHKGSSK
jgi:hypothetical protein